MKFSEIQPGRYNCKIVDWTLTEEAALDNALKVKIQLDINVDNESVTGWYDGLIKKKDGSINEKTLKALLSSGFHSTNIYTLSTAGDALDTQKNMEVTIVKTDKGITKAEWLNSAGESSGQLEKRPLQQKKDLIIEGALAQALKIKQDKKKVKNYAPGSSDDELNF